MTISEASELASKHPDYVPQPSPAFLFSHVHNKLLEKVFSYNTLETVAVEHAYWIIQKQNLGISSQFWHLMGNE
jgi:hypothetical protein